MKLKHLLISSILFTGTIVNSQTLNDMWNTTKDAAKNAVNTTTNNAVNTVTNVISGTNTNTTPSLTNDEVIKGLKEAINKVKVTSYWQPLATAYNKIPGVKKQNPDLNDYVCTKAINGLMLLIQDEEMKIRKDPLARVTDLLKKVFSFK